MRQKNSKKAKEREAAAGEREQGRGLGYLTQTQGVLKYWFVKTVMDVCMSGRATWNEGMRHKTHGW